MGLAQANGTFDDRYGMGVVAEDRHEGDGMSRPREGAFALQGCVVTPVEVLDPGYVVIGPDGAVDTVRWRRPQGVRVVTTEGVIIPGLIDLHGHPEFNVFAPWEPPDCYANRYEWRSSAIYQTLIRDPENHLLTALAPGVQARYAEVRALVAGTTSIQGASQHYPDPSAALIRNIDLRIFGQHRARSLIDLPSEEQPHDQLKQILHDTAAGLVDAFYVHLAEGRGDDPRSRSEFRQLVSLGGLTRATIVIHGCALTREEFGDLRDAGGKLVWSPQSNLRLYGETTPIAEALEVGVPVAFGADWMPTGSPSLLAELRVARRMLARQEHPLPARDLVHRATVGAAEIAGLGEKLGVLAEGRPADVVVLDRLHDDPYESVLRAAPSDVGLVTVAGALAYGRAEWVRELTDEASRFEQVWAWGREMLLDCGNHAAAVGEAAPRLAQLRAALVGQLPQVGPIFA